MVVESSLDPVRFDGKDGPSLRGAERRVHLYLPDGMRASIGSSVAEAQHVHGSIVRSGRCQARNIPDSLVGLEGVEQSAVEHRLEPASQAPFSRYHLVTNPATGGAPIILSEANANAPNVKGITRPNPLISEMSFLCVAT